MRNCTPNKCYSGHSVYFAIVGRMNGIRERSGCQKNDVYKCPGKDPKERARC